MLIGVNLGARELCLPADFLSRDPAAVMQELALAADATKTSFPHAWQMEMASHNPVAGRIWLARNRQGEYHSPFGLTTWAWMPCANPPNELVVVAISGLGHQKISQPSSVADRED